MRDTVGFVVHWIVAITGIASAALGGVNAAHPIGGTAARAALVTFAMVLSLGVGVIAGWRYGSIVRLRPLAWFDVIGLAAATFSICVAVAQ